MKRSLIVVAMVAAITAMTPGTGEAFGITTTMAIAIPATGDGSVAIACGILAYQLPRSIQCSTITADGAAKAFDLYPNVTFRSISSGRDVICGLQSDGGTDFFCWRHAETGRGSAAESHTLQITYQNHVVPLRNHVVGDRQIAATDQLNTSVLLWRHDSTVPTTIPGSYHSLTSGAGFFCAIDHKDKVVCWGPKAQSIYPAFGSASMSLILSAGESHACGITKEGRVICGGNNDHGQSSPPDYPSGEFVDLALGSTHTCGVRGVPNRTVVCWGAGGGEYSPVGDRSFFILAANGRLTCGLRTKDSAAFCWWTPRVHGAQSNVIKLPLRREVLAGICTRPCSCPCDVYALSQLLCANSKVICTRCEPQ